MPYLLLTLAALFWGGNYVVGHILVQGADPIVMTEARWALTAMLLVGLYQRQIRESWRLLRGNASTLLILTLCGQVSFPLTLYIGLQTTSALNAAIYMSATPCMVLMINRLIFHDRVSARNWCGVAFSTAGVLLLLLHGNLTNAEGLKGFSQGDLWAMGSALSWAVYCSLLRNKDRRIPANAFVAVSSLIGSLMLLLGYIPDRGFLSLRGLVSLPDSASGGHFLAMATPRHLVRRVPRYLFPHRPGVSDYLPLVAGLFVLEQRHRRHWRDSW